jgi:hypothetical protein
LDPLFDFTIYVCNYALLYNYDSYEIHINFSVGRKAYHLLPR